MSTRTFRRKSSLLQAWQFLNQPRAEWPQFLLDYKVDNQMFGPQAIGSSNGVMLVPTKGTTLNVQQTEWLVWENERLLHFNSEQFFELFEELVSGQSADDLITDQPVEV